MKKTKKVIVIISVVLLIVIAAISTLFTVRYFKYKKSPDDIKTIKIHTYHGYLSPVREYIIDFNTKTVAYSYEYMNQSNDDNQSSSSRFTEEDAEYFIKKANLYGFFGWKESYKLNGSGDDLPYSHIYITYKDDSVQEIYCLAEYPRTYEKMEEAFNEAFGGIIL